MIDLRKLQYFITVANEGNITNAAKKLNITQPPLTHQIKVLEKEIGVKLIQKVGRNIQLTEAGRTLQNKGEELLELTKTIEKTLHDIHKGESGTLTIGAATSWGAPFLSEQIYRFSLQYPQVQFRIYDDVVHNVVSLLRNGVVELGVILPPFDREIYNYAVMSPEPLVAVMTKKWDDNPSAESVTIEEIAQKPLIINRQSERIQAYCRDNGINPNIVCFHDDVRSMILLAKTGLGIAIIPNTGDWIKYENNMVIKRLHRPPTHLASYVKPCIVWLKTRRLSTIADNFLKLVMQENS